MELINMLQSTIMEHLGRFGFLTVSQFQVLTGKSAGYLREMLGSLSRRGYVRSFRIEISHKMRSENMYVNTTLAVEYLTSHKNIVADDIKTTTTQAVVKDFFHRFNTINVNIALWQFFTSQNIPIRTMVSYFDKIGSPKKGTLTARSKIALDDKGLTSYIPDSAFKTEKGLYLIEMYCDKNSQRILAQLGVHAKGIANGSPAKAFDIQINPSIMAVFDHKGIQEAIIKRLSGNENFTPAMSKLFFFASLEDVKTKCATAWRTINGEPLIFK